jgi:asparagine synthase (glutamine-hydrolysing)
MLGAIFGSYGSFDPGTLQRVRRMLRHRGGSLRTHSPAPRVLLCSLAHDGSGSPTGRSTATLVYTGRITNFDELARLTGNAAEPSHVLMRLHEQQGHAALKFINGSFAIAWFDHESQTLTLSVDRWGVQPLYFAHAGQGWLFASEYKALLAALADQAVPDAGVAGHVVSSKYLPLHKTLDKRIIAVGPGEYVILDPKKYQFSSYRPLELDIDDSRGEAECATELRERILTAAYRLTRDHDAIGVGLSAGLDSAITLGAVRKVAPHKRIYAYTASFDRQDPTLDKAAEVADYFGARHRRIIIEAETLPSLLSDMVWRMEDPVAREEMVVYDAVARHAAGEVTIVLYGHMADILFGGMPRHLLIKAASELRLIRRAITEFYDYTQVGAQPRSLLAKLLVKMYFRGHHPSPPALLDTSHQIESKSLRIEGDDPLNSALLHSAASPSEVSAIERLHAWAGVEMGSIFHDRDVSLCAFRIPGRWKIRGRRRKHILRLASSGIIPARFAERPKDLIRSGRNVRMRAALGEMSEKLLSPAAVRTRGLFQPADVDQVRSRALGERCSDQDFYYLWSLVLTELWCRTFVDRLTPQVAQDAGEYAEYAEYAG